MVHAEDSLVAQAYSGIREEIMRGRLRPGMPLSRRNLAEQLTGPSRGQWLARLDVDGLRVRHEDGDSDGRG